MGRGEREAKGGQGQWEEAGEGSERADGRGSGMGGEGEAWEMEEQGCARGEGHFVNL